MARWAHHADSIHGPPPSNEFSRSREHRGRQGKRPMRHGIIGASRDRAGSHDREAISAKEGARYLSRCGVPRLVTISENNTPDDTPAHFTPTCDSGAGRVE